MTRVCIAVPCLDFMMSDFAFSLGRLMAHNRNAVEVLDLRGSEIAGARNKAAAYAMAGDFTHLLFLDSDMWFPTDTLDRLLSHGKPIVGATYIKRCAPYNLLGAFDRAVPRTGLVEALELPAGCLLINVTALRKIAWPWFQWDYGPNPGDRVSEDIWFCRKAREAGLKIYCDMDLTIELGHIGVQRYDVSYGIEWIRKQTRGDGK